MKKFLGKNEIIIRMLQNSSSVPGCCRPEEKIIGRTFVEVFEEEAKKLGDVSYLLQGTTYLMS